MLRDARSNQNHSLFVDVFSLQKDAPPQDKKYNMMEIDMYIFQLQEIVTSPFQENCRTLVLSN